MLRISAPFIPPLVFIERDNINDMAEYLKTRKWPARKLAGLGDFRGMSEYVGAILDFIRKWVCRGYQEKEIIKDTRGSWWFEHRAPYSSMNLHVVVNKTDSVLELAFPCSTWSKDMVTQFEERLNSQLPRRFDFKEPSTL